MTVVLDAYAVIAYLRGEPASDQVAELLAEPTLLAAAPGWRSWTRRRQSRSTLAGCAQLTMSGEVDPSAWPTVSQPPQPLPPG